MKKKIVLIVVGILLTTSILIGISYAYYMFNISQSGRNAITTDCFKVLYTDENPINLVKTIPISDAVASELTPYTFTINNVCNHSIDYDINIETLNDSTIDLNAVRVKLNNFKSQILGEIDNNDSSVMVNSNALSSKKIKHGSLKANTSKTYNLRIYVDEDSTVDQSADKTFSSKVVVSTRLNPNAKVEASLISGPEFNIALKTLSGNENPDTTTNDETIISIQRSTSSPQESDNYVNIADENSDYPIYAWFNDGVIYLYSIADIFLMNENSSGMFSKLIALTSLDLSYYNTRDVVDMSKMFDSIYSVENIDVSNFDTSKVENMSSMFSRCNFTNIDLSNFDTSNVRDMSGMFGYTNLVSLDLSSFDTSNVTNMRYMFTSMRELLDLNVSSFDTSNVTDMSWMFDSVTELEHLDLSNFDTSKVTKMEAMFENMKNLVDINLSSFNTSNVTDMKRMFSSVKKITSLDLSNFDTSKVTTMTYMFSNMTSLVDINLSSFNTSNVKYMSAMFFNSSKIKVLDLSSFDTSNVLYLYGNEFDNTYYNPKYGIFEKCSALQTIYVGSGWKVSQIYSNDYAFFWNSYLKGGSGTTYNSNNRGKDYAVIDCGSERPGYLTYKGPIGDNAAYCASIGYSGTPDIQ